MDDSTEQTALEQIRTIQARILDKLEEHDGRFDQLHLQMVRMEQDHGLKLEALFDGQLLLTERMDRVDGRMDSMERRMDRRMDRLDVGQLRLRREVGQVRRSVDQLQAITSDHEHRLPVTEQGEA